MPYNAGKSSDMVERLAANVSRGCPKMSGTASMKRRRPLAAFTNVNTASTEGKDHVGMV